MTRHISLFSIGLFLMALFAAISDASNGARQVNFAARSLDAFRSENACLVDMLLQLGRQARIPLAIEYVDLEALEKRRSVSLTHTTVGRVLSAITAGQKNYTWQIRDGVIAVEGQRISQKRKPLFDTVLPEFSMSAATLAEGSNLLWMTLYRRLHPDSGGFAGEYNPGVSSKRLGPLELRNATVRQVLDRLVSEERNAAWIVRVPPRYVNQLPDQGLWMMVEYDDPQLPYITGMLRRSFMSLESSPAGGH